MSLTDGPALEAARGLRAKLDAAAIEVLRSGKDWAEGPYEFPKPDLFPAEPQGLFEPVVYTVECKAGAVDSDWVPPPGWRVVRHADWVAAGAPGCTHDWLPGAEGAFAGLTHHCRFCGTER